jgi:hypothetical protein
MQKDVKIVETNSTTPLLSVKVAKKRTQNEGKRNTKTSARHASEDQT